jgi:lipopolysaccharide export system protein LptA
LTETILYNPTHTVKAHMRSFTALLLMAGLMASSVAHAEKADAEKPTNVEANQMAYDDVKQVNTFIGNVVLTRGTVTMKSEKMVVTQDPEGYQYATLYAPPGGLATFRQKRDGGPDLWMEGQAADRIEYNGKTEVAKFFVKARVKLLDGPVTTDQVDGEYISYDSRAEFYSVNNMANGESKPGAGRIRAVIQPRNDSKKK